MFLSWTQQTEAKGDEAAGVLQVKSGKTLRAEAKKWRNYEENCWILALAEHIAAFKSTFKSFRSILTD